MTIRIRQRNAEVTSALRAQVERRLSFALSRFGQRIARVTVRLSESDDACKRCQITVGLRPRIIEAEDTDVDLLAAVDHAANRISRSIARALDREHTS
jgi:ribosome hibernation promoting factor